MGKHKKDKKSKKPKKKKSSSSSDESGVSWAEAGATQADEPKQEGSDWLTGGATDSSDVGDLLTMFTKDGRKKEKKTDRPPEVELGQHTLELNPYWRQGGQGLPPTKSQSITGTGSTASRAGGGVEANTAWLRRSYTRAVEMAKEEGCSVESYLRQRWEPATVSRMLQMFGPGSESRGRFSRPTGASGGHRNVERRVPRMPQERPRFSRPTEGNDDNEGYGGRGSSDAGRTSNFSDRQTTVPRWKKANETNSARPRWKRKSRSRSPRRKSRSRSRSKSRSKSPRRGSRSKSPRRKSRSRSPRSKYRSISPRRASKSKSPRRDSRSRSPRRGSNSRSPRRRSRSPRQKYRPRSKSPSKAGDMNTNADEVQHQAHPVSEVEEIEVEEEKSVTDEDINKMAAQIMRAEMMGNQAKISKLKANLEKLREAKSRGLKIRVKTTQKRPAAQETVLLSRINKSGVAMPVLGNRGDPAPRGASKIASHDASGQRISYFHREGDQSLSDLVREERMTTAADSNRTFANLAGKAGPNTDEGEYRDAFVKPKARLDKEEAKEKTYALKEHKIHSKSLNKCETCIEKHPKHLVITRGEKCFLYLPAHTSLTPHHCILAPLHHAPSATQLDEDVWAEMTLFKRQLVAMYDSLDQDCVVMETAYRLNRFPHMRLECVPMPRDCGDMAPVYFKKALQDAGPEWSQNKKIVELKDADIRRSVPKGFPYFSVEFGRDGGFAHVIENEESFVPYFGREILGGILDKGPEYWRHPAKENFKQQSSKVIQFEKDWRPFNRWDTSDDD